MGRILEKWLKWLKLREVASHWSTCMTWIPRHCRNLPEHFNLTPRTLQNPSKPQIRLQNAPEWNLQTFQSQNAVWTFRNFPRPRSSESEDKSRKTCHAKTNFQWHLTFQTGQPNVQAGDAESLPWPSPPNATPALWRSMLRRLYHALDGSSSQAYSALASFNACFHVHRSDRSAFSYIGMSVVNECILEDIHMNTRITIELNAYMFYHVPKHKTPQNNTIQQNTIQNHTTKCNTKQHKILQR